MNECLLGRRLPLGAQPERPAADPAREHQRPSKRSVVTHGFEDRSTCVGELEQSRRVLGAGKRGDERSLQLGSELDPAVSKLARLA